MDMSAMTMTASDMAMTFYSKGNTPLWSTQWTPTSTGAYAGTCIFLILFTAMYRGSFKLLQFLEHKWLESAKKRRYVVVADKTPIAERVSSDADSKTAVISVNGVEENVRVIESPIQHLQPWRFSVDLPRAFIYTCIAGMGYLIMLAVMTLNTGYFLSVLGGVFLGEVAFGRYGAPGAH